MTLDSQILVRSDSLVTTFGSIRVNEPVSFVLRKNQLGLLTGGNGTGKTTILKAILGEVAFEAACLEVFGKLPPWRCPWHLTRSKVRVIPQFPLLPPFLTLRQYLAAWEGCTVLSRYTGDDLVRFISDSLFIAPNSLLGKLSFGQRRMIEILLACEARPELLLADEPLAGLAMSWIDLTVAALESLRRASGGVLMVVHEVERQYWHPDWVREVVAHQART